MNYFSTLFTLIALTSISSAQNIFLTFDTDQTDFGSFETTTDTELTLNRSGGSIAFNDFTELTGLATETYTVSGPELGTTNPFGFTVTTSGGNAVLDTGGLDVAGGGIDNGESITFTFSHDITLTEFDLANVSAAEFATISVAGVVADYADSPNDVHTINLTLNAGQSLVFQFAAVNSADYDIQGLGFSIVPEPQSYVLIIGFCCMTIALLRNRRHQIHL